MSEKPQTYAITSENLDVLTGGNQGLSVFLGTQVCGTYSQHLFGKDKQKALSKHMEALFATAHSLKPQDAAESMLICQMVTCHNAAMECHRRANLENQTFEGRQVSLNHAAKFSRTYVQLLETLDKRRGKTSQQNVTVKHVHVHDGGQAVVGNVTAPGGGLPLKTGKQPHAKEHLPHEPATLADAHQPTLPCENSQRQAVPVTGDA